MSYILDMAPKRKIYSGTRRLDDHQRSNHIKFRVKMLQLTIVVVIVSLYLNK